MNPRVAGVRQAKREGRQERAGHSTVISTAIAQLHKTSSERPRNHHDAKKSASGEGGRRIDPQDPTS